MYFYIPGVSLLLKQTISSKGMRIEEKCCKRTKNCQTLPIFFGKNISSTSLVEITWLFKKESYFPSMHKTAETYIQIISFLEACSIGIFDIKSTKKDWYSLNFLPSSTTTCHVSGLQPIFVISHEWTTFTTINLDAEERPRRGARWNAERPREEAK